MVMSVVNILLRKVTIYLKQRITIKYILQIQGMENFPMYLKWIILYYRVSTFMLCYMNPDSINMPMNLSIPRCPIVYALSHLILQKDVHANILAQF